jgi:hypothetical protein
MLRTHAQESIDRLRILGVMINDEQEKLFLLASSPGVSISFTAEDVAQQAEEDFSIELNDKQIDAILLYLNKNISSNIGLHWGVISEAIACHLGEQGNYE